jgi:hypothetical protein
MTHQRRTLVRTARAPADNRVAVGSTPTACTNKRNLHHEDTSKTGAARRRNPRHDSTFWTCDRSSDRPGLLILWAPWRLIVGASPTTSSNLDQ